MPSTLSACCCMVKARIRPPQALAPLVIRDQCNFHSYCLSPARAAPINPHQVWDFLPTWKTLVCFKPSGYPKVPGTVGFKRSIELREGGFTRYYDLKSWRIREESLVLQQQRWVFPHYPFLFGFPFQLVIKGTCQQTLPTQDPRRNNFATKMSPKNPHGTSPSQCGPLPHPVWYTSSALKELELKLKTSSNHENLRIETLCNRRHKAPTAPHLNKNEMTHIKVFYKSYLRYVYSYTYIHTYSTLNLHVCIYI